MAATGDRPHVLLVGGPGQGKTTLGRLLVQLYRADFLADRPNLSLPVSNRVDQVLKHSERLKIRRPANRRWPIRIDLAAYASVARVGSSQPLLRYLAEQISATNDYTITAPDLRNWLRAWPWLLILDGLDEVAAQSAREEVIRAVVRLLDAAHAEDADLMVVVTTRPQGYGDELGAWMRTVKLLELTPEEAEEYGQQVTAARLGEDTEARAVIKRIGEALSDDLTARLMRTPLQIMIMSHLLESRAKPPQDRADLFETYYNVVYEREVAKGNNHLATLLGRHRPDITAIHAAVGLALQIDSETARDSEAILSRDDFELVVRQRLLDEEHEGESLDRLVRDITIAAHERLVLVEAKGSGVGFRLRSFQEFMAAKALVDATDEVVLDRIRRIAPAAHWRNTWLLAVGSIHRHRPGEIFDRVLQTLREMDAETHLGLVVEIGPRLAAEIILDGVANSSPKQLKLLTKHALEALNGPGLGVGFLGDALIQVGNLAHVRPLVVDALQKAAASDEARRANAWTVLRVLRDLPPGSLRTRAAQLGGALQAPIDDDRFGRPQRLSSAIAKSSSDWPEDSVVGQFKAYLQKVTLGYDANAKRYIIPGDVTRAEVQTTAVLRDPAALEDIALAISQIDPANRAARAAIAALLFHANERLPVGQTLGVLPGLPRSALRQ